jgi:hypothetical protein
MCWVSPNYTLGTHGPWRSGCTSQGMPCRHGGNSCSGQVGFSRHVPFFAVREWTVDSSVVVVVGRWVVGGRGGHLTLSNSIKIAGLVENLSFVNVDVLQVVHRGVAVGSRLGANAWGSGSRRLQSGQKPCHRDGAPEENSRSGKHQECPWKSLEWVVEYHDTWSTTLRSSHNNWGLCHLSQHPPGVVPRNSIRNGSSVWAC